MSSYIPTEVRLAVLARDGGRCVAPRLDRQAGRCAGPTHVHHVRGNPPIGQLEITQEGGFGKRPPADLGHCVAVCELHHVRWAPKNDNWLLLVDYLRTVPA